MINGNLTSAGTRVLDPIDYEPTQVVQFVSDEDYGLPARCLTDEELIRHFSLSSHPAVQAVLVSRLEQRLAEMGELDAMKEGLY